MGFSILDSGGDDVDKGRATRKRKSPPTTKPAEAAPQFSGAKPATFREFRKFADDIRSLLA